MPLNELLPKALKLFPYREAVVCGHLRLNYQQLARRVWQLSHGLRQIGLVRGDRVAVLHENCHIFLEAYLAAVQLGLILVPLNFRLAPAEIALILNDSQARLIIAQNKFPDKTSD